MIGWGISYLSISFALRGELRSLASLVKIVKHLEEVCSRRRICSEFILLILSLRKVGL